MLTVLSNHVDDLAEKKEQLNVTEEKLNLLKISVLDTNAVTSSEDQEQTDSSSIPNPLITTDKPLSSPTTLTEKTLTEEKFSLKPQIEQTLHNYQWELALPGISGQNYIICAPTGTGKTRVAGLIVSEHLKRLRGKGKVVFVVNKVILTHQQKLALEAMIIGAEVDEITGEVAAYRKGSLSPRDSSDATKTVAKLAKSKHDIIVCTAGCLLNELKCGKLKITDLSLIIIDECHHTKKNTDYAKIMEYYLSEKLGTGDGDEGELAHDGCHLPQVVGLTATPGAEANLTATMEHMISLCAQMDAIGGIKIVHKNVEELDKHRNVPEFTMAILKGRSHKEEFISIMDQVMSELEKMLKLQNVPQGTTHWSQKYTTWVAQAIREYQSKGTKNQRDYLSTLELLQCLSRTLATYMDLRFDDAMEVLDEFSLPAPENSTQLESQLSVALSQLKTKLRSLECVDNPMLIQLGHILSHQFTQQPESRAIIFVETKKQAASLSDWILSSSELHIEANIHPKMQVNCCKGS